MVALSIFAGNGILRPGGQADGSDDFPDEQRHHEVRASSHGLLLILIDQLGPSRADPQHQLIVTALTQLTSLGTTLHFTHQNIAELWNVKTRPLGRNGLGLTANEAAIEVRAIERGMILLPDSETVCADQNVAVRRI